MDGYDEDTYIEIDPSFEGTCTCEHSAEQHGWGQCEVAATAGGPGGTGSAAVPVRGGVGRVTVGAWCHVGVRPQLGALIEIDWLGTTFIGRLIKTFEPWTVAWDVDIHYFSVWTRKLISTSQIKRWRYVSFAEQQIKTEVR